ncbi:MAG: hypothetical protein OMM_12315 [Candidatus Magnetoglobus multicellularis str. Araruama]|uniref:Uncharacterized protein n=1 Tax=Candidatus Magnetoglobus multicellularis str. Araruama TaxID=890399 RepID=A0A1V1NW80_9BACT|nr:MAG: hypothetical protein OMM_12315 [Candidatus Magnetoglobus multicellularis str. Araruama]
MSGNLKIDFILTQISVTPVVSIILEYTEITDIPIHISNIDNHKIGGYMIRLEYDDSVLLDPKIITTENQKIYLLKAQLRQIRHKQACPFQSLI